MVSKHPPINLGPCDSALSQFCQQNISKFSNRHLPAIPRQAAHLAAASHHQDLGHLWNGLPETQGQWNGGDSLVREFCFDRDKLLIRAAYQEIDFFALFRTPVRKLPILQMIVACAQGFSDDQRFEDAADLRA